MLSRPGLCDSVIVALRYGFWLFLRARFVELRVYSAVLMRLLESSWIILTLLRSSVFSDMYLLANLSEVAPSETESGF